jgi:2-polyprenyl-6-methoxyphenol hydroxylase-like FAD-dependent oxidoreductase
MLAGELALAGVDVGILERRPNQELAGQRAGGLHARTIEVLDQRGIADRFLAAGQTAQVAGFAGVRLDISDFPTRHPYGLALRQNHIERLLAGWVGELGAPIAYGSDMTGFVQDGGRVDVSLGDGSAIRAQYLVGCDGGRSLIRKTAGIEFPGWEPTTSNLIAEVEVTEEPEWGIKRDALGIHAFSRIESASRVGVLVTEGHIGTSAEPTLRELSAALVAVYGTDFGAHSPTWLSRFTDTARQAAAYRAGRVLLAGDAAHIHPPDGGQGLNIGAQDAVNLGWKLAQVVKGIAPEPLLDTYQAERHPIAARVLRTTMASVALRGRDDRMQALADTIAEVLGLEQARKHFAGLMSGLDIRYDLGDGHPLVGRRMPDLELGTASGTVRVFGLLHAARPVLLTFGPSSGFDIAPWAARVQMVHATYQGEWELPVVGVVPAPPAVLVRPDGYVAWAGELADPALAEALSSWFGAPAPG